MFFLLQRYYFSAHHQNKTFLNERIFIKVLSVTVFFLLLQ